MGKNIEIERMPVPGEVHPPEGVLRYRLGYPDKYSDFVNVDLLEQ